MNEEIKKLKDEFYSEAENMSIKVSPENWNSYKYEMDLLWEDIEDGLEAQYLAGAKDAIEAVNGLEVLADYSDSRSAELEVSEDGYVSGVEDAIQQVRFKAQQFIESLEEA